MQIYWKKWSSDQAFYVTIADADIGSLSLSIHYLVLLEPLAGEIWTKSYGSNKKKQKIVLFDNKMVNNFDKVYYVDAILEDVSLSETTIWC